MTSTNNAFTTNVLGLEQHPFPYLIESGLSAVGSHQVFVCPMAVKDVAEVLIALAQSHLLVFDVDHTNFKPDALRKPGPLMSPTLVELAHDAGVPDHAYDPEVVAIAATSLPTLLEGLNHYEIKIIDLPRLPTSDEAIDLYCHFAESTRDPRLGAAGLPLRSRFFLHSHDDCYTSIEADSREMVLRIVEKSLRLYAGTLIGSAMNNPMPDIAAIPVPVLERLLAAPAVTMLRHHTEYDGNILRIGFAHAAFKFQNPVDAPLNGHVSYDVAAGIWCTE